MWLTIDETITDQAHGIFFRDSFGLIVHNWGVCCVKITDENVSFLRFTLYVIMMISWSHSFHPFTLGCWGYSKCILLNINNVPVFFSTDLNMSIDCVLFLSCRFTWRFPHQFEIITALLTPAGLKKTLLVSCVCLSPEMSDSFWLAPNKSLLKKM